jgi:sulfur carrier protein ThiS
MRIKVKTGGLIRRYLPEGSGAQCELDVADGATATAAMAEIGLPMDEQYLVMLNGTVLPIADRTTTVLNEGDELGLFPPLKGG